jgi:hypothetical protein
LRFLFGIEEGYKFGPRKLGTESTIQFHGLPQISLWDPIQFGLIPRTQTALSEVVSVERKMVHIFGPDFGGLQTYMLLFNFLEIAIHKALAWY